MSMNVLPNVLIIGDSISMGYTELVKRRLEGKATVHRSEGNASSSSNGVAHLDEWVDAPNVRWDVIHFNFGLHDIVPGSWGRPAPIVEDRQVPPAQYEKNIKWIVERLKQTGAKLVFATTTPVPRGNLQPPRRPGDETEYNGIALRIMNEMGVAIDDLYHFALPILDQIQKPEDVHFTDAGYETLADAVAASILAELNR